MSVNRQKYQCGGQVERQPSLEQHGKMPSSSSKYCLHRYGRSKHNQNTKSLQSIQVQRVRVAITQQSQRRKLLNLAEQQLTALKSQRVHLHKHTSNINLRSNSNSIHTIERVDHNKQSNGHNNRYAAERMNTIDQVQSNDKQKKITDCIRLMKGVLVEIHNQKSNRRILRARKGLHAEASTDLLDGSGDLGKQSSVYLKRKFNEGNNNKMSEVESSIKVNINNPILKIKNSKSIINKDECNGKFESYIDNLSELRQQSKRILLKRNKTKSTTIEPSVRSTFILNAYQYESIQNHSSKLKEIQPLDPNASAKKQRKDKLLFEEEVATKLQEIDCSMIKKINQSSFMSQLGKKSFIKQLEEPTNGQTIVNRQENQLQKKGLIKIMKNRKLRNLFPDGFF